MFVIYFFIFKLYFFNSIVINIYKTFIERFYYNLMFLIYIYIFYCFLSQSDFSILYNILWYNYEMPEVFQKSSTYFFTYYFSLCFLLVNIVTNQIDEIIVFIYVKPKK